VLGVPLGLSGSMAYLVGAPISAVYISFKISLFTVKMRGVLMESCSCTYLARVFSSDPSQEKIAMDDKST